MARYRKKPVVVEAEQFFFYRTPYPRGVAVENDDPNRHGSAYVVTAHGQKAYLDTGDWVITEPDGRGHYPCKDAIFRATYDPVDG